MGGAQGEESYRWGAGPSAPSLEVDGSPCACDTGSPRTTRHRLHSCLPPRSGGRSARSGPPASPPSAAGERGQGSEGEYFVEKWCRCCQILRKEKQFHLHISGALSSKQVHNLSESLRKRVVQHRKARLGHKNKELMKRLNKYIK